MSVCVCQKPLRPPHLIEAKLQARNVGKVASRSKWRSWCSAVRKCAFGQVGGGHMVTQLVENLLHGRLFRRGIRLQAAAASCAHARVLSEGKEPVAWPQLQLSGNLHVLVFSKLAPAHRNRFNSPLHTCSQRRTKPGFGLKEPRHSGHHVQ